MLCIGPCSSPLSIINIYKVNFHRSSTHVYCLFIHLSFFFRFLGSGPVALSETLSAPSGAYPTLSEAHLAISWALLAASEGLPSGALPVDCFVVNTNPIFLISPPMNLSCFFLANYSATHFFSCWSATLKT